MAYSPLAILAAQPANTAKASTGRAAGADPKNAVKPHQSGGSFVDALGNVLDGQAALAPETGEQGIEVVQVVMLLQMAALTDVVGLNGSNAEAQEGHGQPAEVSGEGEETVNQVPGGQTSVPKGQDSFEVVAALTQEDEEQGDEEQGTTEDDLISALKGRLAGIINKPEAKISLNSVPGEIQQGAAAAVPQQLKELLREIASILQGSAPDLPAAGQADEGSQQTKPNVLSIDSRGSLPDKAAGLGLEPVLRQLLIRIQEAAELPAKLQEIKELVQAEFQDQTKVSAGEFLNRLAAVLKPAVSDKSEESQVNLAAAGLGRTGEAIKQTLGKRANHQVQEALDDEPGPANMPKVIPIARPSAANVPPAANVSGDKAAPHDKAVTSFVQQTVSPQTGGEEGPIFTLQTANETKIQFRPSAKEPSAAGDKQIQMQKMNFGILDQIAQKVKLSATPERTEMQIQLKPEFLGKLDLTISTENGMVTAKFNTASYHVKGIIEASLNTLKDSLAEQGVKVDQLMVTVSSDREFSSFQQREAPYQQHRYARGSRKTGRETSVDELFFSSDSSSVSGKHFGSTVDFIA